MKPETRPIKLTIGFVLCVLVAGCASGPQELPYPAYIRVADLPDIFIAGLPGIRAKQLAGNPQTRRSSNQIELPADWSFTTGAAPGLSTEIYVLAGELSLGGLAMRAGGYAYIPPGSSGMQLATRDGAVILYFLDEANVQAVIKTPLVADAELLEWQPPSDRVEDLGIAVKELRADPGSGARTWLQKVDPIATQELRKSTVTNEGFLLSGSYTTSECIAGKLVTGAYLPGGYFHRPPAAIHGGSAERSTDTSVWFMRVLEKDSVSNVAACEVPPAANTVPSG